MTRTATIHGVMPAREPAVWDWFHVHGTMHPIDTYERAIAGDAEALRVVARDLDNNNNNNEQEK